MFPLSIRAKKKTKIITQLFKNFSQNYSFLKKLTLLINSVLYIVERDIDETNTKIKTI